MGSKVFSAKLESLEPAVKFIRSEAEKLGFDKKKINQIELVSEEILVNIINYAYPEREGSFEVNCTPEENNALKVRITDWGVPFNPLSLPDPDVNLPIEEREIGGLGIYLVRRNVDEVSYERQNDANILTFVKR